MIYDAAKLIQHILEGDQKAFAALVEKYQKQIHTLIVNEIHLSSH